MKKKWKILLACVVAVTAACAAAWYLLPRPAVGEDYEVQYINVGETLENITGQIDQNTCNALNDLLRQAERRGYRRNVFPRQLREDTVRLARLADKGLEPGVIAAMVKGLDGQQLMALKQSFEARAAEKYPVRTQLSYAPAEGERDREHDRAFLI